MYSSPSRLYRRDSNDTSDIESHQNDWQSSAKVIVVWTQYYYEPTNYDAPNVETLKSIIN